jgi:hypothetical protein
MAIFSASGSAPIHHRPPSALTQSAELDEIETLKRMFADKDAGREKEPDVRSCKRP